MKKRLLAFLLAGAMMVSMLPNVVFAASNNRVSKTPTVKDDFKFYTVANPTATPPVAASVSDAPVLVIEAKDWNASDAGKVIRLQLDNAKWEEESPLFGAVGNNVYRRVSSSIMEVTLPAAPVNVSGTNYLYIPLAAKMGGKGDAKVTIDPRGSTISSGTYVFAIGAGGNVSTTIADTQNFAGEVTLDQILVDELRPGTIELASNGRLEVKLVAPKGFEWKANATGNSFTDFDVTGYEGFTGATGETAVTTSSDKRDLVVSVSGVSAHGSRSLAGSLAIDGLILVPTDSAKTGDVELTVKIKGADDAKLKVGSYVDYNVKVYAEDKDVPAVYAGFETKDLLKLTIEETVADSWWSTRKTTITFPDFVRVLDFTVDKNDGLNESKTAIRTGADINKNKITFERLTTNGDAVKLVLKDIKIAVEPGAEGKIEAVVGGPSMPEDVKVVLAKVEAPITVDFKTTEVELGYQDLAVNTIKISEVKAGILERDTQVVLSIPDMTFDRNQKVTVKVTEGDLEVENVKVDSNYITFSIKRDSDKASTLEVSGVKVKTNRYLPYGSYELRIGGNALIAGSYNEPVPSGDADIADLFDVDYVGYADFIKVVTPGEDQRDAKTTKTSVFTIGSTSYKVGDETLTMDVAPFIQDGRTMMPVKYVAFALGISEANILWDNSTGTVTILDGSRVLQVKINTDTLVVNGAPIKMDTKAIVKDGRSFLPVSWLAKALDVSVTWDGTAQTATFN